MSHVSEATHDSIISNWYRNTNPLKICPRNFPIVLVNTIHKYTRIDVLKTVFSSSHKGSGIVLSECKTYAAIFDQFKDKGTIRCKKPFPKYKLTQIRFKWINKSKIPGRNFIGIISSQHINDTNNNDENNNLSRTIAYLRHSRYYLNNGLNSENIWNNIPHKNYNGKNKLSLYCYGFDDYMDYIYLGNGITKNTNYIMHPNIKQNDIITIIADFIDPKSLKITICINYIKYKIHNLNYTFKLLNNKYDYYPCVSLHDQESCVQIL